MRCPVCGIEMRVAGRGQEEQAGVKYTRLEFACRNKQCHYNGQVMATKRFEAKA